MATTTGSPVEVTAEVMGRVAAGIAVLTLVDDGVPRGMTISSLTPVSVDPPSVLVCIGGSASCLPSLVEGRSFCVNVLASDQTAVSAGFAWGDADPFETFAWSPADDGTPVLAGTTGHLLCRVERIVEHHGTAVVLAAVEGGRADRDESLVYWRKQYFGGLLPAESETTGVW